MDSKISRPCAFLDRDGVLNRDRGYVYKPEDLEILPGVLEGLELLHRHDFFLVVVSNQAGIGRGYFKAEDVDLFHKHLQQSLERRLGFGLDAYFYCPHHPAATIPQFAINCQCRKPNIGMLEAAGREFPIDWTHSFIVGDRASDIQCGLNAGIKTIEIQSDQYAGHTQPHARVANLLEAAKWICPVL